MKVISWRDEKEDRFFFYIVFYVMIVLVLAWTWSSPVLGFRFLRKKNRLGLFGVTEDLFVFVCFCSFLRF
jgi:hypothetical protein